MADSETKGYDIVLEVDEPTLNAQLAVLPKTRETVRVPYLTSRLRIRMNGAVARIIDRVTRDTGVVVSPGLIEVRIDIAGSAIYRRDPPPARVPVDGTLVVVGRIRALEGPVPGTKLVVVDFTSFNGGPIDLRLEPAPGTQIHPEDSMLLVAGMDAHIRSNLRTVSLAAEPLSIQASPAGILDVTQVDATGIFGSAPDRRAVAVLLRSCRGPDPSLNHRQITTSLVPNGQQAVIAIANFALLRCIVRASLLGADGRAPPLPGLRPEHFDPSQPCRLATTAPVSVPDAPQFELTAFEAVVHSGQIRLTFAFRKATWIWVAWGTARIDITFALVAGPDGPRIEPQPLVHPPEVHVDLTPATWLIAAAFLPLMIASIYALTKAIVDPIIGWMGSFVVRLLLILRLKNTFGGAVPLGPLAEGFEPAEVSLPHDLLISGSLKLATPAPRELVILDDAHNPIDAVLVKAMPGRSDASFRVQVRNAGANVRSINSLAVTEDADQAFEVGQGLTWPRKLKPLESIFLPGEFRPKRSGFHSALLTLSADNDTKLEVDLEADATAYGQLQVTPNELKYGRVVLTGSRTRQIQLANVGIRDLDVLAAAADEEPPGQFVITPPVPSRIAKQRSDQLRISYVPTALGEAQAKLTIDAEVAPNQVQQHEVEITGSCGAPAIAVAPAELDFGVLEPGETASASFTVRNDGDMELALQDIALVSGTPDFFLHAPPALPLVLAPGISRSISVGVTGGSVPGSTIGSEFELRSDDPVNPRVRVACSASTIGPRIEVTDYLDFGHPRSLPATMQLVVENLGSAPLRVEDVKAGPEPFTLTNPLTQTLVLGPNQDRSFEIEFAPTEQGIYNGEAQVQSRDPTRPLIRVMLKGAQ